MPGYTDNISMTSKPIITLPNATLRQPSKQIRSFDSDLSQLIEHMTKATLKWEAARPNETAVALAAVQIGELWRVVIIRKSFRDKNVQEFRVLVNPEIIKSEGELVEGMEGCLSISNTYGKVHRYNKVKVKALDETGKPIRLSASGFLARVLQHEIDHTNGKLFIDHVSDPAKLFNLEPDGSYTPLSWVN